jgi:hypothetical protein
MAGRIHGRVEIVGKTSWMSWDAWYFSMFSLKI